MQQKISPLKTSLWIGLGVVIWHIPVLTTHSIPWPIMFVLPAVSVVYAWFYQNGKSIWPLVILHLMQNIVGGAIFGSMFNEQETIIWIGFLTLCYITFAIFLAWRLGLSLVKNKEPKLMVEGGNRCKLQFKKISSELL